MRAIRNTDADSISEQSDSSSSDCEFGILQQDSSTVFLDAKEKLTVVQRLFGVIYQMEKYNI